VEKSSCQCCQDGYAGAAIIAEIIRASLPAAPMNEGSGSHVRVIVSAGVVESVSYTHLTLPTNREV